MGKHYDVIIAGGGLVGSAMACALGKNAKLASKQILMLEGGPKRTVPAKKPNDPYSNRVVSLNPGTRHLFQSLGVWGDINRYGTVKKMQVWDSCSDAMITFDHPGLIDDISYIVENDVILHALNAELARQGRVQIGYDSRVKKIDLPASASGGRACVQLDGHGDSYTCDLLIGAEGFKSGTRQAIESRWVSWSYQQNGVVATLRLAEPTENVVAWQRFLPTGPIALLPLTAELSSLVWSTTSKAATELVKMADDTFVDAVNDALWKQTTRAPVVEAACRGVSRLLGSLQLPGTGQQLPPSISAVLPESRASFPLGFGHSVRYVGPAAALIGDAAHRVHPLAGQGVNLGFGDVECLTSILAEAAFSGERLGKANQLRQYERRRQLHNCPTMLTIDALHKLYTTEAPPVVLLRSLGMQITNSLSPVKRAIMNHASG